MGNLVLRTPARKQAVIAVGAWELLGRHYAPEQRIVYYKALAERCAADIRAIGSVLNYVGCWCVYNDVPVLTALVRNPDGHVGSHYPSAKFGDYIKQTELAWERNYDNYATPTALELWHAARIIDPGFNASVDPESLRAESAELPAETIAG